MKWCSKDNPAPGPHQRRHAGADAQRRRLRRHRHRPDPDRAHVLRGRPHRRHARDDPGRQRSRPAKAALAKLLPYQSGQDFLGIFKELKGLPATIRFLDPPLHEFLPTRRSSRRTWRESWGSPSKDRPPRARAARVQPDARLPRLPPGHQVPGDHRHAGARRLRGRRRRRRRQGIRANPEIMIPSSASRRSSICRSRSSTRSPRLSRPKRRSSSPTGRHHDRVPRGALTADEIAQTAEFFSFGTNDLTQTGLGMSRDDSGSFLRLPGGRDREKEPLRHDRPGRRRPAHEDRDRKGPLHPPRHQAGHLRRTRRRPGFGEVLPPARPQAAYVSCSPFRVPVARLAAGAGRGGVGWALGGGSTWASSSRRPL
jgi:pyruvate,orthophosphate dikinase